MNQYSDDSPPRGGNAKRIFDALQSHGFRVIDLHYNANLWGRGRIDGWGTWACTISDGDVMECWCGWDVEHGAYLQGQTAPYAVVWVNDD